MESTIKDEAKATAIFQDFNNDVDKWKLKYPKKKKWPMK